MFPQNHKSRKFPVLALRKPLTAFKLTVVAGLMLQLLGSTPPVQAAVGACTSPADCLSKMTLDEKIGQMTQANKNSLTSPSDITTYLLGSLLSGGGEGPSGKRQAHDASVAAKERRDGRRTHDGCRPGYRRLFVGQHYARPDRHDRRAWTAADGEGVSRSGGQ